MAALPAGMPRRMAELPTNTAGYPIPWFIDQHDNPANPDFRFMDGVKLSRAIRERRCWVCGKHITGPTDTFVIGPMCAVNRTTAEPPSHRDCAEWSAKACPFLVNPKKVRRDGNRPEATHVAGQSIPRNPGVVLLWTTHHGAWHTWEAGNGVLMDVGEPTRVAWIAEGREATRDEVLGSIESGLPILLEMAEADGADAVADLQRRVVAAIELVPS